MPLLPHLLPPSVPPSTPLRLRQILHPRRRAITARPHRILRHERPRLHAALDVVEIPDLVQRAAGALDDGRDAAGFLQGREDGGGGVGLRGGGEDGGCGEELRGREVSGEVSGLQGVGVGGWGLEWGRCRGKGKGKGKEASSGSKEERRMRGKEDERKGGLRHTEYESRVLKRLTVVLKKSTTSEPAW